ncbi:MAG: dihydropteroate synthase [Proteobacteria bacterium]|nr:MAG: dihydropteroate synthase [Pseudomonadota bacterium]
MNNGLIMGIVNVTPDSFSDGGLFLSKDAALKQVHQLMSDGADILDIGAESSRPGAPAVPLEEEWNRLLPLLKELDKESVTISVDTYKPEIMRRLKDHNVTIINDIKGGAQIPDEILKDWANLSRTYLGMHMHLEPETMQQRPLDVREASAAVSFYYDKTRERLQNLGFPREKIWLDPGIGFGKTDAANLYLIREAIEDAGRTPLVMGISRKSFIGRILDIERAEDRDGPSKMLELSFLYAGVKAIRTHNVKHLKRLRDLTRAT